jgi:hypothetical protein
MALADLTDEQREVVRRCLDAVVKGPFICDGDFHCLFGLRRNEVEQAASRWPELDEADEDVRLAINGSLNSLLIWYGWQDEDPEAATRLLHQWTGASPEDIEQVFQRWCGERLAGPQDRER